MKALGDNEKIEKEIDRMILEYKSIQPRTLFNVWARKSITNQNPATSLLPTPKPTEFENVSTTEAGDTDPSSMSNPSLSNSRSKCRAVNYFS